MADLMPPMVAPPPIRAARPSMPVQALSQMQEGMPVPPAEEVRQIGMRLLRLIQQQPGMRAKLTQALSLLTEAVQEGLPGPGAGMPPPPQGALPPGQLPGGPPAAGGAPEA